MNAEERADWRRSVRARAAEVTRYPAGGRAGELFAQLGEEVLSLRIEVAQQRDGMLNEAELIAKLDACEESGR